MMGLEMMLSNLIGVSPDELRQIALKITNGVDQMQKDIGTMKADIAELKAHLGLENDNDGGARAGISDSGGSSGGSGNHVQL